MPAASDGSSSKTCPRCHRTYPRDYSVCTEDGAPLRELEEWRPGDVIRGKFRVLGKVGPGSTGTVYKAELVAGQEPRALKLFFPSISTQPALVQHLREAVRSARAFDHPGAVRLEEVLHDERELLVLVMEYAAGESLEHVIRKSSPLPVPRAVEIFRQLCSLLEGAHRLGLIHRNLHPGKVLVIPQSEPRDFVKVRDFGMAAFREAAAEAGIVVGGATKTKTGFIGGTPQYMSPEQAMGKGGPPLDGRSDLYSVGVLMYEALTGELPFSANTPQGLMLHHIHTRPTSPLKRRADLKLPEDLVEMAMKALEKNPALRFESAGEMAAALEEFQKVKPASPARSEPPRLSGFAGGVPTALRAPAPDPAATQITPPALALAGDEEEPAPDSDSLPLVDLDEILEEAPLPTRAEAAGSPTFEAPVEVRAGLSRPAERAARSGSTGLNPLLSPGLADLDLDEINPAVLLASEEEGEGGVDAVAVSEVAKEPPRPVETKREPPAEPPTAVLVESQAKSPAEVPPQQSAPPLLAPVAPAVPTAEDGPVETRSQNRPAADVMATAQPVERVRNVSPAFSRPAEPPRGKTLREPAKLPVSKTRAEPPPARRSALGLSITEVTSREVEPPAGKRRARITAIAAGVILCAAAGTWWALRKSRDASSEPAEEAVSTPALGSAPPVAGPSRAAETPATTAPKATAVNSPLPPASLAPPPAPAPKPTEALTSARPAVTARARKESSRTPQAPLPVPSASARTSPVASKSVSRVASVPARSRSATAKAPRAAPPLSPAQLAELKDRVAVAGFLMERGDYDGALDAFEAALKIDASNRDAQAGEKKARQARDAEKTNAP